MLWSPPTNHALPPNTAHIAFRSVEALESKLVAAQSSYDAFTQSRSVFGEAGRTPEKLGRTQGGSCMLACSPVPFFNRRSILWIYHAWYLVLNSWLHVTFSWYLQELQSLSPSSSFTSHIFPITDSYPRNAADVKTKMKAAMGKTLGSIDHYRSMMFVQMVQPLSKKSNKNACFDVPTLFDTLPAALNKFDVFPQISIQSVRIRASALASEEAQAKFLACQVKGMIWIILGWLKS